MDNKNLVILIIVAVLFFTLGGGLTIFYQMQSGFVSPKEAPKITAVQNLSSKVIPSITAYGQVSKIEGRDITLTLGGDSLKIKINNNAQVFLPSSSTIDKDGKTVNAPQQIAKFSDIKIGDNVSVNLKLLPDGQIEGAMVVIVQSK